MSEGSQEVTFDLPYIPEKKSVEDIISQEVSSDPMASEDESSEVSEAARMGERDEPVPKSGYAGRFDTEPGYIEVVDAVLPEGPLPLCIDNEWLSQYYVTVISVGGYTPKMGAVFLNQMKGDDCFEGIIFMQFTEIVLDTCPCASAYVITFFVCEPFCLDSNHLPIGFDQDVTLDKWVDVCFAMEWEGCHLPEQSFMVILAHKAMSQNPKLPIFTSPVKS